MTLEQILTPQNVDLAVVKEHRELGRAKLRDFARFAWPTVEPAHQFIPNWHIDAICDHLQAVADGQIKRLLVNVPPGHAKSLLVAVLWPAWMWIRNPEGGRWRALFASYAEKLALRDSVRCRDLMRSQWYLNTYLPGWEFASDQNEKGMFTNSQKGFRIALGVSGQGTGYRGDCIVCLSYETKITTSIGEVSIGEIVERRSSVQVLAFDHSANRSRWQDIEAYESAPGRPSVRVRLSDGSHADVTKDHLFFLQDKGYTRASELHSGDALLAKNGLSNGALRGLRRDSREACLEVQKVPENVLQPPVLRSVEYALQDGPLRSLRSGSKEEGRPSDQISAHTMQLEVRGSLEYSAELHREADVPELRRDTNSYASPRCASNQSFLQRGMPERLEQRPKQSSLSRRQSEPSMLGMRGLLHRKSGDRKPWSALWKFLLNGLLQKKTQRRGQSPICQSSIGAVRHVRHAGEVEDSRTDRQANVLLPRVRGHGAFFANEGSEQPTLDPRPGPREVPPRVLQDRSKDPQARRLLSIVPEAQEAHPRGVGCSPYRLRQDEQRGNKPNLSVPKLPYDGSREPGAAEEDAGVFVVSVDPIPTPARVYNIRVAQDHNYFASGVLVNNCDDPLNATSAYSDADLDFCLMWWDQAMSSRLNDMANGTKVIIMQRLSDRDLSGHVIRQGGYEHLRLPTEFEASTPASTKIAWSDPRKAPGELLFPALFPREVIEDVKIRMGSAAYSGQHQQHPTPAGGGMLKKHWWRYWQPRGANLPPVIVAMPDGKVEHRKAIDLPASFDMLLQSWDMAFKDLATSDYVVGQVHGALGADRFLLDQVRDRMDMPRTLLEVRMMSGRWPHVSLKLVEDKANGPAVVQSLRHEISGFVEVNPKGGKVSRAAAASPQLESGNWYLPHPKIAPWVEGFIAECAAFPAGLHDDQVDAWSQGSSRLLQIVGKKPSKGPPPRTDTERSWMV